MTFSVIASVSEAIQEIFCRLYGLLRRKLLAMTPHVILTKQTAAMKQSYIVILSGSEGSLI